MTVICAMVDSSDQFVAFSDILLSRNKTRPVQAGRFPFRHPLAQSLSSNAVGFRQKSIVIGSHLIMWSGSFLKARAVIRFLDITKRKKGSYIAKKLENLNWQELSDLSIIYANIDEKKMHCVGYNCYLHEEDDFKYICAGSGSGDLLYEKHTFQRTMSTTPKGISSDKDVFSRFSKLLGQIIHLELNEGDFHEKRYGGGYEIVSVEDSAFRKIPYRLDKFNAESGLANTLGHSSTAFFHYQKDVLIIHTLDAHEQTAGLGDELNYGYLSRPFVVQPLLRHQKNTTYDLRDFEPEQFVTFVQSPIRYGVGLSDREKLKFDFTNGETKLVVDEEYLAWARETNQWLLGADLTGLRPEKILFSSQLNKD